MFIGDRISEITERKLLRKESVVSKIKLCTYNWYSKSYSHRTRTYTLLSLVLLPKSNGADSVNPLNSKLDILPWALSTENLAKIDHFVSTSFSRRMAAVIGSDNGALCLFAMSIAAVVLCKQRMASREKKSSRNTSFPSNEYFPPLPDEVVEVLRTSKLCYLATQSDGNPHLSLMNFTYCRKEEVIILSTRRNTKKFYQIVENPKVAVLIHDFPETASSTPAAEKSKQWSITLNGVAEVSEIIPAKSPNLLTYNLINCLFITIPLILTSQGYSRRRYDDGILQVSS